MERTRVLIVGSGEYGPDSSRQIRELIQEVLGPAVEVDVEHVEEIPCQPSGKSRYIQSNVSWDR